MRCTRRSSFAIKGMVVGWSTFATIIFFTCGAIRVHLYVPPRHPWHHPRNPCSINDDTYCHVRDRGLPRLTPSERSVVSHSGIFHDRRPINPFTCFEKIKKQRTKLFGRIRLCPLWRWTRRGTPRPCRRHLPGTRN